MRVIGVLQIIRAFEFAVEAFDMSSGYYRPMSTTIGSAMTHTVLLFLLGVRSPHHSCDFLNIVRCQIR
jgi:hypothetical protein